MNRRLVDASKLMTYVLRHHPEALGLKLDAQGYVAIDDLVEAARNHNRPLDREMVMQVVAQNDKKRFMVKLDRIRAVQGHSVEVDLGLQPQAPPDTLYHGTAKHLWRSIQVEGLTRGSRQHVHLSPNLETAMRVGSRHGKPIVLVVESGKMHQDHYAFFLSENGVWLTDHVPSQYLFLYEPHLHASAQ